MNSSGFSIVGPLKAQTLMWVAGDPISNSSEGKGDTTHQKQYPDGQIEEPGLRIPYLLTNQHRIRGLVFFGTNSRSMTAGSSPSVSEAGDLFPHSSNTGDARVAGKKRLIRLGEWN